MKLSKVKVQFSDALLSDSEMKDVIGETQDSRNVPCNPQDDEHSCHGVCYYEHYQGACGMEVIQDMEGVESYVCACFISGY